MGVIQRQGIQSTVITYAGMLTGFVSLLIVQPLLLSPEEIGLTRVLFSFSFLLSTLLPLSASNITTRYLPKFRNIENGNNGFLGFVFLILLSGILLILPVVYLGRYWIMNKYVEESALFVQYFEWVFPFSIILAAIYILNAYLYAVFRPLMPAFAQEVLVRLFFILLIVIYASGYLSLHQFVISYVITYLLQLCILLIQTARIGAFSFRINKVLFPFTLVKEMLIYGFTIFGAGVASLAIKLLDAVVLGQYVPLALVGIYGIAAYMPIFIEAPVNALDKVASARVAHAWEKGDMENIQEIYYKSARYLFVLGGFLFLMVTQNVRFIFKFLPASFYEGVPVVGILSLAALFNLMTGSNTAIIFSSKKFGGGAIALVAVAVLNLILLFALIPPYGLIGAAWATCISSLVYNLFKFGFIFHRFKLQPFDKRTLFIAFSITLAYGAASLLPLWENVFFNIFTHTFIAGGVYIWMIWYFKVADDLIPQIPLINRFQKMND
jgi:O-antigen/teichoic acid export membrane protein